MRTLTFSITPRHLAYWTAGIITGVFMGATIQHLIAWTGPSATPPGNNAEAPINVSAITQVKNGDLGLAGNLSAGMVQLNTVHTEGTACPLNGLLARDASGATLSCVSLVWVKGGGGTLSSYEQLPVGTLAGYCIIGGPAYMPATWGWGCGCVTGWQMIVLESTQPDLDNRYAGTPNQFTCIKR